MHDHPFLRVAEELSEAVDLSLQIICVGFGEFGVAESTPYIVPPAQSLGVAQGRARHRLARVFSLLRTTPERIASHGQVASGI